MDNGMRNNLNNDMINDMRNNLNDDIRNNMNNNQNRRGTDYMGENYYCMVHVVEKGDTLYLLSRKYGVKLSVLMMANPFADIYNLKVGDELCIPRLRPQIPQEEVNNDNEVTEEEMNMQRETEEYLRRQLQQEQNVLARGPYYGIEYEKLDDNY